jgi:hypothetical protein
MDAKKRTRPNCDITADRNSRRQENIPFHNNIMGKRAPHKEQDAVTYFAVWPNNHVVVNEYVMPQCCARP